MITQAQLEHELQKERLKHKQVMAQVCEDYEKHIMLLRNDVDKIMSELTKEHEECSSMRQQVASLRTENQSLLERIETQQKTPQSAASDPQMNENLLRRLAQLSEANQKVYCSYVFVCDFDSLLDIQ